MFETIPSLLSLIDRAISLAKQRDSRNQAFFKEIVEPVFIDAEKISNNYNLVFNRLLSALRDPKQDLKAACERFSQDRIELKTVRDKVVQVVLRYHQSVDPLSKNDQLTRFMDSVIGLIASQHSEDSRTYFIEREITELMRSSPIIVRVFKAKKLNAIAEQVNTVRKQAEEHWQETATAYAQLKLKYTQPS
jgi:hypothetical protein